MYKRKQVSPQMLCVAYSAGIWGNGYGFGKSIGVLSEISQTLENRPFDWTLPAKAVSIILCSAWAVLWNLIQVTLSASVTEEPKFL